MAPDPLVSRASPHGLIGGASEPRQHHCPCLPCRRHLHRRVGHGVCTCCKKQLTRLSAAKHDLAEAIDLIWMLDAAVRGLDFDPDTPNGRAAAGGLASTFELVVEKLKGVGEANSGDVGEQQK